MKTGQRVRKPRTAIAAAVVAWLFVGPAAGDEVGGTEIPEGGYLWTRHSNAYVDAETGFTVEGWFYFTGSPGDNERWLVFGKPGTFSLELRGRILDDPRWGPGAELPVGSVMLTAIVVKMPTEGSGGWMGSHTPVQPALRVWTHICVQVQVTPGAGTRVFLFWRQREEGGTAGDTTVGRARTPLYIGGTERVKLQWPGPWPWGPEWGVWGTEYSSVRGRVESVRVSRGIRYPVAVGGQIEPERPLQTDQQTTALWRLESSRSDGGPVFRDLSWNGHWLYGGGALPVAPGSRWRREATWRAVGR